MDSVDFMLYVQSSKLSSLSSYTCSFVSSSNFTSISALIVLSASMLSIATPLHEYLPFHLIPIWVLNFSPFYVGCCTVYTAATAYNSIIFLPTASMVPPLWFPRIALLRRWHFIIFKSTAISFPTVHKTLRFRKLKRPILYFSPM